MGHAASGAFGYSHLTGGFAGGQAEFARVPFADVGPLKIENGLSDEQVLFLSDILPTGYMGAEMCDIKPGDTDRGVGLRSGRAVRHQERVPARRRAGDRASTASTTAWRWRATKCGAETLNYEEVDSVPRDAEGDDRGPRPGRLHRRGRPGSARPRPGLHRTTAPSRR